MMNQWQIKDYDHPFWLEEIGQGSTADLAGRAKQIEYLLNIVKEILWKVS